MKLREYNFNDLKLFYKGLSIFKDDKEIAMGFIGEVLRQIPDLADCEIESTNSYFDVFVIRLK